MANTIITKNSSTASAVPSAGSLTQGELAVNVTDKKLYTKNSGGSVVEITPTNATNVTGTGTGSIVTSALGSGTANSGTYLRGDRTWAAVGGGVTSLNGQTGAITNTTYNVIGSVALGVPDSTSAYSVGSTISGSSLRLCNTGVYRYSNGSYYATGTGANVTGSSATPSGTWRFMNSDAGGDYHYGSVFMRIS
jgi:hypothetical protein